MRGGQLANPGSRGEMAVKVECVYWLESSGCVIKALDLDSANLYTFDFHWHPLGAVGQIALVHREQPREHVRASVIERMHKAKRPQ